MTNTITIKGRQFTVEPRYAEGHVLTENEAAALNQTFYENLRNNFSKRAEEGADQAELDEYAAAYKFGVRVGGSRSSDPVALEAMNIARNMVRDALRKSPEKKLSDYTGAQISGAAERLLASAKGDEIRETAKQNVANMQAQSSDLGNLLDDIGEPAKEDTPEGETKPKRNRKAANAETAE